MGRRAERTIWSGLFDRATPGGRPLQTRIREMMVSGILEGRLPPGDPVPSIRELAHSLGVARNTVLLAYEQLVEEGFLVPRERSGYYVSEDIVAGRVAAPPLGTAPDASAAAGPDWTGRLGLRPSAQRNIVKPRDWLRYPYPFLYGQFDPTLFPIADWRECCRDALGMLEVRDWACDLVDGDDPLLIEQIRSRALPRRGVFASPAEIIVTLGAQQALFLLAELLVSPRTVVGIEDPGYPDARNIFALKRARLRRLEVDADGLVPDETVAACDYAYVTPSHQCPTTVTMPLPRRRALLALAAARDVVLVEDDYESEINFADAPTPALKSLDEAQRVVYVGSLSKTLAPGLRLGYVVAPPALVAEARALRRLMVRHPPANNQRAAALFLARGYHDALVRRLTHVLRERAAVLAKALARHLPGFACTPSLGGSSYWVRGPEGLDARALAQAAQARGVLIEPGDVFFLNDPPRHVLRLGFSSIPADRIEAGIAALAALVPGATTPGRTATARTARSAAMWRSTAPAR